MRISDWSSDVCSSDLGLVSFIWPSSAPTTSTGDMPLISAGDMLPAPAMLALDNKNLFGERFTLHGPSPSKERDRAARMPPGRVGIGRAACRERRCQYGELTVGAVALKQKTQAR